MTRKRHKTTAKRQKTTSKRNKMFLKWNILTSLRHKMPTKYQNINWCTPFRHAHFSVNMKASEPVSLLNKCSLWSLCCESWDGICLVRPGSIYVTDSMHAWIRLELHVPLLHLQFLFKKYLQKTNVWHLFTSDVNVS